MSAHPPRGWRRPALALLVAGLGGSAAGLAAELEPASFHHVHLRVADPERSQAFYRRHFGAQPIRFHDAVDGLYVEGAFLLLDRVEGGARGIGESAPTGIWHIGWGAVDVAATARWLEAGGVEVHTPLYTIPGTEIDVTYWYGPDREMIEVNTMRHHRFAHVHLLAHDPNRTAAWYQRHLGLAPRRRDVPRPTSWETTRAWSTSFRAGHVSFVIYGAPGEEPLPPWWSAPPVDELRPTRGTVIDHVAFSVPDLDPVLERLTDSGATLVEPPAIDRELGLRRVMVEGPDRVLIEVVEAEPLPQAIWR